MTDLPTGPPADDHRPTNGSSPDGGPSSAGGAGGAD